MKWVYIKWCGAIAIIFIPSIKVAKFDFRR
ncbi:unknown [Bacteroides sp. CAG:661]|nr:unknown [Bacteroides sp. CAG:661]